jgi:hypothetical protein
MSTLAPELREAFERLLESPPTEVLASGQSPVLLRALDGPVPSALVADRAPAYVTVLHAMVLLRRRHELEPLHEDLFHQVREPLAASEDYDLERFAQDMGQLESWGAVQRVIEPARVRSYKDNRRERYRYRLTADALAMVEWLEGRVRERLSGRARDGRDLLQDITARLAELHRLLKRHRKGQRDEDAPRRSVHLLLVADEAVDQLGDTLLGFRAAMLAFASRPYDLKTLTEVLRFLETYVEVYLRRIEELRTEIARRLRTLRAPRFRETLADLRARYDEEGRRLPSALGGGSHLRPAAELLEATAAFFADGGQLEKLCQGVDDGARQVLRKMRRRLRELERRSQRVQDLRACVRLVAQGELEPAALVRGLVASAHVPFGSRGAHPPGRVAPPLPRKHKAAVAPRRASAPLRTKRATAAETRALRAAQLAALSRFLGELTGGQRVQLGTIASARPIAPRDWMDAAKARHLGGGRDLERAGFRIEAAEGRALLSEDEAHLEAPDCHLAPDGGSR